MGERALCGSVSPFGFQSAPKIFAGIACLQFFLTSEFPIVDEKLEDPGTVVTFSAWVL